ncbi:hypothetical protein [Streptomyces mirabilis]|uniref:hypothetical protein n=1 Tax=Streptomyces mirabilis TaxID=68239 RepID=UPI0033AD1EA6
MATKTSFALFLLHSLFTSGALGARAVGRQAEELLGHDIDENSLELLHLRTSVRLTWCRPETGESV